jgi:hypothetical protein
MKLITALLFFLFAGMSAFCADPNSVHCEYAGSIGNLSISVNVPAWPELFGKAIAVYPRGIAVPATVNEQSLPFYKTQLSRFLDRLLTNCPDITLNHLKRCEGEFALVGDIKINGLNLSRILIEEALAEKSEPAPPAVHESAEAPQPIDTKSDKPATIIRAEEKTEQYDAVQPLSEQAKVLKFCASKNSKIYHLENCPSAKRITEDNLILFDNLKEAVDSGRTPCQHCLTEKNNN